MPMKSWGNSPAITVPLPNISPFRSYLILRKSRNVYRDRHIKRVLELGRNANIAIFSVGTVRDTALFFRLGYADSQEKNYLKTHAVGDICSRFFDKDGNISSQELNDRTVGIDLDDLRHKEYSILLSGGDGKIASIRAALKGGYANVLITDQFTAKKLLAE